MDRVEEYRSVVEKILNDNAAIPYSHGEIELRPIFNREQDTYLLLLNGWDKRKRIHGVLVHIDIINGKIWIQRDGTEDGIADDLERAGVPKSDIVLAFHAPELRKHTEYAVA